MTDLEKIELAIRRAITQKPNRASGQFRLVADEIAQLGPENPNALKALLAYRNMSNEGD
jgi:hypothetical protein